MSKFRVTKTIDFCYGHRLLDYDGKCRHLHGHNGLLEVDVESERTDALGMVVDFSTIKEVFKEWVDRHLDHRLLLCRKDPLIPMLREAGEPLFLMDENPTAENIARLLFQEGRRMGLNVSEIRLWETPSSCSAYREDA